MLDQIKEAVIDGDTEKVLKLTREEIAAGTQPDKILNEGLVPGLIEVGKRMAEGAFFIPEVLVSARAMKAALALLEPLLLSNKVPSTGKVVLATVEGDVHDIGKNLVKLMIECAGFEVVDLGVNVSVANIIKAVREHRPQILGLSSLLTTTTERMGDVISSLRESDSSNVKIMVGGAAVTREFATKIGADAYSPDCVDAAKRARELIV